MRNRVIKISKFLSLVLRHKPEQIGITLDQAGWVLVSELLNACTRHSFSITRQELEEVVRRSDKQRFAFSDDRLMIRANQGHSVEVKLDYQGLAPPKVLYHGTATRFLDSIIKTIGSRHGEPMVLIIESLQMHQDGLVFYRSENGVWLTDHIPPAYIKF